MHVGLIIVAISAQPEPFSRRGPRSAILLAGCNLLWDKVLKTLCCYWWLAWLGVRALRTVEGLVADVLLELLLWKKTLIQILFFAMSVGQGHPILLLMKKQKFNAKRHVIFHKLADNDQKLYLPLKVLNTSNGTTCCKRRSISCRSHPLALVWLGLHFPLTYSCKFHSHKCTISSLIERTPPAGSSLLSGCPKWWPHVRSWKSVSAASLSWSLEDQWLSC